MLNALKYTELVPAAGGSPPRNSAAAQHGEGVGLSIVKRLGELLDASLEVASSPDTGTTLRVVLPRSYALYLALGFAAAGPFPST